MKIRQDPPKPASRGESGTRPLSARLAIPCRHRRGLILRDRMVLPVLLDMVIDRTLRNGPDRATDQPPQHPHGDGPPEDRFDPVTNHGTDHEGGDEAGERETGCNDPGGNG